MSEEVARLHLDRIGVKLTKLTHDQADYIGVTDNKTYLLFVLCSQFLGDDCK